MTLYRTVSGRFHQRLEQGERRRVGAPEELGGPLDAEHKAGRGLLHRLDDAVGRPGTRRKAGGRDAYALVVQRVYAQDVYKRQVLPRGSAGAAPVGRV